MKQRLKGLEKEKKKKKMSLARAMQNPSNEPNALLFMVFETII